MGRQGMEPHTGPVVGVSAAGGNLFMPALQNSRQERFAQLVALGTMSLIQANRQAGYSDKAGSSGAVELTRKLPVVSRIEQLRAEQQAKTEAKLEISRDRILQELADMALAKGSSMMKLKAIELLAKL
jgi:hypothetical protein